MRKALLALVVIMLAAELALRALGYSALQWYRADSDLGWTLRPGLAGWFADEGRSFVKVNSAGFRDREHALAKPQGVYRVAVLGDAYSEAMQVPLEQSYWAQLPERLERCGFAREKRIEVLNFGVRDYGTAQAYLVLEKTALKYRPDLVLLQFSHGNDVRDNSPALDGVRGRPYYRLDAQGGLVLDDSFTSTPQFLKRASPRRELMTELLDHSRLLQLGRRAGISVLSSAHAAPTGNEAGLEIETLAPPDDAQWADAWRITEALIARIGESAARAGARTALVVTPFAMEVHPDAALRQRLLAKYGVADFAYPDRRLMSFAREHGMLGILLVPDMQALARSAGAPLYGYENKALGLGHWNDRGHRAAAEIIARTLCANPSW